MREPGRAVRRPAAAADRCRRLLATADDHPLGTFCHHVYHTTISCFWSSGGQYRSLGADFSAAGSRGVNRVASNFLRHGDRACSLDDDEEGSIIQLIFNIPSGRFTRLYNTQSIGVRCYVTSRFL